MSDTLLTKARVREILSTRDLTQGIESLRDLPPPSALCNVLEGAELVARIMREGGEILIIGDYDADGVCASAIMLRFFEALGYERVRLVIPHRFSDGYGVSAALLERELQGARVVVSVDNGISAFCAGEFCAARGVPFIITDHHTPLEHLPRADFIINPCVSGFAQREICGAVVAWYFCAGLKQILGAAVDMRIFLDCLCIASIGDVMPLVGINRALVKAGLTHLERAQTPLAELLRAKLQHISASELAFYLVPLLNAAGRVAHAYSALALLCAKDIQSAHKAYEELSSLNSERKRIQDEILHALNAPSAHSLESEHYVLCYGKGWHEGVLGIIASRLAESRGKSACVLTLHNGVLKGSARSFGGLHLMESIAPLERYLLGFGGHAGAMGLSLELRQLEHFMGELDSHARYEEAQGEEKLGVIAASEVDLELLEICEGFEPYGEGNEKPVLCCENLEICACKPIGKQGQHYALSLLDRSSGVVLEGVEFFAKGAREVGWCGSVSFELMRDSYRGGVKLKILSMQPATHNLTHKEQG